MLRTSLWRIDGNPPNGHDRACATVRGFSHRQVLGSRDGVQPYRRHSPSRNSAFERVKPWRELGRHVSQLEAPFSSARLIASALSSWLIRNLLPPSVSRTEAIYMHIYALFIPIAHLRLPSPSLPHSVAFLCSRSTLDSYFL